MPLLHPFRGYRFSTRAPTLADVVTQPYDKITTEQLSRYRARSPYNVAHVISNPDYARAGKTFGSWIQNGQLVQDSDPGFYIYRQQFRVADVLLERTGVIGLLDLGADSAAVLRHEQVMDAPLQDRLQLIASTESNDGLIFLLLEDSEAKLESMLQGAIGGRPPAAEVRDELGVLNQVWLMDRQVDIESLQCQVAKESSHIADGHHRFETAIRYSRSCWEKNWRPRAVESFDKRMVALFSSRSEGIIILPTLRAIRGLPSGLVSKLRSRLEFGFDVSEESSPEALAESIKHKPGHLGLLLGPRPNVILLRDRGARSKLPEDLTGTGRELDVNLLHRGILEPLLGIGRPELNSQQHVDYYRHFREILPALRSGHYQMAFLLNATTTDQVRRISREVGRMPQKSTDFFPKLLTGLVFMKMEIDRGDPPAKVQEGVLEREAEL